MVLQDGLHTLLRIPCASMAQVAADVEPGTEKGSVVATLGMAVSIVINVSVLTIGAILGTSVLAMLPESIKAALNYLLPALFGALLVQFGMKMKKHSVIMVVFAVILYFMIGMGYFNWSIKLAWNIRMRLRKYCRWNGNLKKYNKGIESRR